MKNILYSQQQTGLAKPVAETVPVKAEGYSPGTIKINYKQIQKPLRRWFLVECVNYHKKHNPPSGVLNKKKIINRPETKTLVAMIEHSFSIALSREQSIREIKTASLEKYRNLNALLTADASQYSLGKQTIKEFNLNPDSPVKLMNAPRLNQSYQLEINKLSKEVSSRNLKNRISLLDKHNVLTTPGVIKSFCYLYNERVLYLDSDKQTFIPYLKAFPDARTELGLEAIDDNIYLALRLPHLGEDIILPASSPALNLSQLKPAFIQKLQYNDTNLTSEFTVTDQLEDKLIYKRQKIHSMPSLMRDDLATWMVQAEKLYLNYDY